MSSDSNIEEISGSESDFDDFKFDPETLDNEPVVPTEGPLVDKAMDVIGSIIKKLKEEQNNPEENETEESEQEENDGDVDGDDEEFEEEDNIEDEIKVKKEREYFEQVKSVSHEQFSSLQISRPIMKAITAMGYVKPTEIQSQAIPVALQGRDICGSAVTGSGKTAAFMIPILERLLFKPSQPAIRVLVLVPTRELGAQCHKVTVQLSQFTGVTSCLCVGGFSLKQQESELKLRPDIVIATPGRLIDHIHNSAAFSLDQIEILVIDEADRIMEVGFQEELREIIKHTPVKRQTMLFSATMSENVDDLIKLSLKRPVKIFVDSSMQLTSKLTQEFVRIRQHRENTRSAILVALCKRTFQKECIIFFRSKADAHRMRVIFGLLGLSACELHGNLSQQQRLDALAQFTEKKVDFMLATDVASRGLDIPLVKTVINYEMPNTYQIYVHRCGRTARGEAKGCAVSLVGEDDRHILKMALKHTADEVRHRVLPQSILEKYEALLNDVQEDLEKVLAEEKAEKQMGLLHMQLDKADNLVKFGNEIASKPKRTWFAGSKGEEMKKGNKSKTDKPEPLGKDKFRGLSRKKKRRLMEREDEKHSKLQGQQAVAAKTAKRSARKGKLGALKK